MDMSFHRNPSLFRPDHSKLGRLPTSGLPLRGRTVDGQVALRALSHVELMALVSTRINQRRIRHWLKEAQADQHSGHPLDARIALFAGQSARHPAWANAALGAFCTTLDAVAHGPDTESALDNKNEHPVYLGGSNNRKETGVVPSHRGRFPHDDPSVLPMDASTTFSI